MVKMLKPEYFFYLEKRQSNTGPCQFLPGQSILREVKCTLRLKSSPAPTGDPPLSAAVLSGGCRGDGELGDTVAGSAEARLKLRGPLTPAIPLPSSCGSAWVLPLPLAGAWFPKRASDLGASHQHLPFQKAVHSPPW